MPQFEIDKIKKRFKRGVRRVEKQKLGKLISSNFFQLLAMWGIAVIQPLLGVLGNNAETFIRFRITGFNVLLFIFALTILPPALGVIVELALIRNRKAMYGLHLVALTGLGVIAGLQVAKFYLKLESAPEIFVATIIGCGFAVLLMISKSVGEWLRVLAIVPVIAVSMFVFNTPAGRYARGSSVEAYDVETGKTPIIYVMFDEFPLGALLSADGTIDADRFPNFAKLASDSTWYRNYTSTSETTDLAVPSALSGKYPGENQSVTYVDHPDNLFTWLGGSYKVNVSEFISQMCPPSVCTESNAIEASQAQDSPPKWRDFLREMRDVFGQRIDLTKKNEYDAIRSAAAQADTTTIGTLPPTTTTSTPPQINTTQPDVVVDESTTTTTGPLKPHNIPYVAQLQPDRWTNWVNAIPDNPEGTLNYIHLMLPHQSWVFYPDGSHYMTTQGEQFINETSWETKVRQQRMILQVQYVDKLLGQLIDKLEANDVYKNSLIVLQADHGVTLTPGYSHRFIDKDYATAPDIVYPPLFIHAPGQTKGVVSDENVENVDLMSILAKIVDTKIPWEMDGMLPEDKAGERASTKTIFLNPHPYDIAPRPEKTLKYNAKELQQAMFARIPDDASQENYLDMLYGDTKYHDLIGTVVDVSTLPMCSCEVSIDDDLLEKLPLLYLRGNVGGSLSNGDWIGIVVNQKISGLSEIFSRDGQLLYAGLVYLEDYGTSTDLPQFVRLTSSGAVELIPIS